MLNHFSIFSLVKRHYRKKLFRSVSWTTTPIALMTQLVEFILTSHHCFKQDRNGV